jgi:hypothetical protein
MKLDPGTHIGLHLVSFGKSGVTISLVSNSCFHSSLLGGAPVLLWIHSSCNSQTGYHVQIDQSVGHWPLVEKEGICAVRPKVGSCN